MVPGAAPYAFPLPAVGRSPALGPAKVMGLEGGISQSERIGPSTLGGLRQMVEATDGDGDGKGSRGLAGQLVLFKTRKGAYRVR